MKAKKVLFTALGVATILGGLVACSDTVDTVEQTASKPKTEQTETKQEQPENKIYKVGDTVSINGLEVTIKSAKFTQPADEYSPAEKGKILTLEVEAVNNSNTQQMVYDGDFAIYDSKGNSYQNYFGYTESPLYAELNKGKRVTGKVFFDVAQDSKYEVIYTTFLGTEVKFEIVPQQ
jgi:Domain of unknown function (DUF4352)